MALKHLTGNLLDLAEAGEFDVVIQGCNCFNTPGRNTIAKTIQKRYPMAVEVDSETYKGDYNKLGNYTTAFTGKFLILNAYTQYNVSEGGLVDMFEYTAFELILQKICHQYGNRRIGLPYIGMSLTGGDRDRIIPMIEKFAEEVSKKGGTVTLVNLL